MSRPGTEELFRWNSLKSQTKLLKIFSLSKKSILKWKVNATKESSNVNFYKSSSERKENSPPKSSSVDIKAMISKSLKISKTHKIKLLILTMKPNLTFKNQRDLVCYNG